MLTGRAPIAQPPGRDTSARAEARQQRPQHQDRGAHGLDQLIGREVFLIVDASTSMRIFSSMVTETPMRPEQLDHGGDVLQVRHVRTVTGPSASRQPARIGSVAFLAPEMRISPSSGMPPWICSLSSGPRPRIPRGVNTLSASAWISSAHRRPERGVHQLVALHGALAGECRGDHHRLEMHVVLAA